MEVKDLIKLLKSEVPLISSCTMGVSLLIFSFYFFKIEYFPIASFESLIYMPLLVSFVSVLYLLFFSSLIIFAGSQLKKTINNRRTASILFGKKHIELIIFVLNKCKLRSIDLPVIRKIFFRFSLMYILNTLIILLLFFFALKYIILLSIFVPIFFIIALFISAFKSIQKKSKQNLSSKIFNYIQVFFQITASNFLLLMVAFGLNIISKGSLFYSLLLYVSLLLYMFISIYFAPPYFSKKIWSILIPIFSCLYPLIIDGTLAKSPELVMKLFHAGAMGHATIYTDKVVCELFRIKGYDTICPPEKPIYKIKDVNILWRIGEYYIKFTNQNGEKKYILTESKHIYL